MPKQKNTPQTKLRSARLPLALSNRIDNYADEQGTTATAAIVNLLEKGLNAVYGGQQDTAATKEDIERLRRDLEIGLKATATAIANQPIAIQEALPAPKEQEEKEEEEKPREHSLFGWTLSRKKTK